MWRPVSGPPRLRDSAPAAAPPRACTVWAQRRLISASRGRPGSGAAARPRRRLDYGPCFRAQCFQGKAQSNPLSASVSVCLSASGHGAFKGRRSPTHYLLMCLSVCLLKEHGGAALGHRPLAQRRGPRPSPLTAQRRRPSKARRCARRGAICIAAGGGPDRPPCRGAGRGMGGGRQQACRGAGGGGKRDVMGSGLSDKERGGGDGAGQASRFGAAVTAAGACRTPPPPHPSGLVFVWVGGGGRVSE